MTDSTPDFPLLETESGITSSEREEIRAHIEQVATENRIPVDAGQFSLAGARRGILLPTLVIGGAVAVVVAAAVVLTLVFRHDERRLQTQAVQYASVEGMLIRELKAESRQMMSSKQKEIEEVRQKLQELEQQQAVLNQTFNARLAQKEEEYKSRLRQEIDAERTRLLTQGLAPAEMERLLSKFETERKAYYDQQLAAFRKSLEAEKTQLQSDIQRLRSEYSTRLVTLEKEQQQIVAGYERRESDLRLQMEQKTQVAESAQARSRADLETAQRELARLNQTRERASAVENQIDGLAGRIMDAAAAGDTPGALVRVRELQTFLRQDSVRSVSSLSSRVRTELSLLNQLQAALEQASQPPSTSEARSLTDELGLLGQMRRLSAEASTSEDPVQRLAAYRQVAAVFPEVQDALAVLSEDAVRAAVEQERKTLGAERDEALAALARSTAEGEIAPLQKQVADLNRALTVTEARYKEENLRRLDALAARARTTRDGLDRRIDDLNGSEDQMNAARAAFTKYVAQEKQARLANAADSMTASRQELNKFLREESIRRMFADLADRVNSLYAATQTAGSSAALAGAAEIVQDVARQPTLKASRQRLQYELTQTGDDAQLKEILASMDTLLAKAQPE